MHSWYTLITLLKVPTEKTPVIKRTLHGGLKIWILVLVAKTIFCSVAALVRKILFCHSKIKFISSRHRVIFSIYLPLESTYIPPSSFLIAMILDDYRDNITLESTKVYLDLPFPFPDCDDIGYYRDNITLESIRVYLDLPFLFPDCDDIGFICNSGAPPAALAEPHS